MPFSSHLMVNMLLFGCHDGLNSEFACIMATLLNRLKKHGREVTQVITQLWRIRNKYITETED